MTGPAGEFAGRWLVDDGPVSTAVLAPVRTAGGTLACTANAAVPTALPSQMHAWAAA